MYTKLMLLVSDEKVLPILRAIRSIGVEAMDIVPVEGGIPALPKPNAPATIKMGRPRKPRKGDLRMHVKAYAAAHPDRIVPSEVCEATGLNVKQVANTLSSMTRQGLLEHAGRALYRVKGA